MKSESKRWLICLRRSKSGEDNNSLKISRSKRQSRKRLRKKETGKDKKGIRIGSKL
jgi:hypothetical protein